MEEGDINERKDPKATKFEASSHRKESYWAKTDGDLDAALVSLLPNLSTDQHVIPLRESVLRGTVGHFER